MHHRNKSLHLFPSIDNSPSQSKENISNPETKNAVEIDFRELADGTLAETIEDPSNPAKSLLAVHKEGHVQYKEKLADGDFVLVPLTKTSAIIRHVRFANGVEAYGSVHELLADIMLIFQMTLDLAPEQQLFLC